MSFDFVNISSVFCACYMMLIVESAINFSEWKSFSRNESRIYTKDEKSRDYNYYCTDDNNDDDDDDDDGHVDHRFDSLCSNMIIGNGFASNHLYISNCNSVGRLIYVFFFFLLRLLLILLLFTCSFIIYINDMTKTSRSMKRHFFSTPIVFIHQINIIIIETAAK